MSGAKRRAADDIASTSKRAGSNNYYYPLQVLSDKEKTNVNMGASTIAKPRISPITILKTNTEDIHKLCKECKITNYSIRKISIGHKLFCEVQYDFNSATKYLADNKMEYFSFTPKNNRPFKVVLSGLDKMDPMKLKAELINIGLSCLDVKPVYRKTDNNREIILYVVYLKKGSVSLTDLRNKYNNINYIRVKWNYQSKYPNKITQCYNCQMYGHGSDNCKVQTFCAKCAGPHLTSSCTSDVIKCANCHRDHKSTDKECRSRASYVGLRDRYSRRNVNNNIVYNTISHTNKSPNVNGNNIPNVTSFASVVRNERTLSNDLFSLEELKTLTLELIEKLSSCKTKKEQFNVVTDLAFKFLS